MRLDWSALDAAMEGRAPVFWWRDDDAVAPSPALDRLLGLTEATGAPLLLASIPAEATEDLARRIETAPHVHVAPHGWRHANHAPPGAKKAEFGPHRPHETLRQEARDGLERIAALFGTRAVPVFVPPWNRIDPALPAILAGTGYRAITCHAQREVTTSPLVRIDALIDPIDWRGSRSAVEAQGLIGHVAGLLASEAPIGLMTHHLVHDEAIWELTARLVERVTERGAVWRSMPGLLAEHVTGVTG